MLPGIAVMGALTAASRGMSPTGIAALDLMYSMGLGATVTLCAAWCPWWLLCGIGALGSAFAPNLLIAVIAAMGAICAAFYVRRIPTARPGRAISALGIVFSFTRLGVPPVLGGPSIVAGCVFVIIVGTGLTRGKWRHTRSLLLATSGLVVLGAASTGFLVLIGLQSKADLNVAQDSAQRALAQVGAGQFAAATTSLGLAAHSFDDTGARLDTWLTFPTLAIPIVSQHRRSIVDLTREGYNVSRKVQTALRDIDLEALKPIAGKVDLVALQRATPPLVATRDSVAEFDETIAKTLRNRWIAQPLRDRLLSLHIRVKKASYDADTGVLAAKAGRTLLGGEGPRRYLIFFITPSEARGLGGYPGNFGELEAKNGQLSLTRFGRMQELFLPENPTKIVVKGPPGWKDSWAQFGGIWPATGTMLHDYWQVITQPPDLSDVGKLVAEIYPQSGGAPIDGLIVVDPEGLGALLRLTGPVNVPSLKRSLDANSAVEFLLRGQYQEFVTNITRVDVLDEVAKATTVALLGGGNVLPDPTDIAKVLSPAARGNHLTMWSSDPNEERLLARAGADNTFPPIDGDSLAVTFQNTSGTKLEAFLSRTVEYKATVDPKTGAAKGNVLVTLKNDASETGLPPYVYGAKPAKGETKYGESQLYVTVYSVYPAKTLTVNGVNVPFFHWIEHGRNASTALVSTLAGSTSKLSVDLAGFLPPSRTYRLSVRAQTSATTPDRYIINVQDPQGEVLSVDEGISSFKTFTGALG
jgi:Protein of unknown function (DUF4012)